MKRVKRTELSGPYSSEICENKRWQWVTLDYRDGGKWVRSRMSPFRSVRRATEHCQTIGAWRVRILPNKCIIPSIQFGRDNISFSQKKCLEKY